MGFSCVFLQDFILYSPRFINHSFMYLISVGKCLKHLIYKHNHAFRTFMDIEVLDITSRKFFH